MAAVQYPLSLHLTLIKLHAFIEIALLYSGELIHPKHLHTNKCYGEGMGEHGHRVTYLICKYF